MALSQNDLFKLMNINPNVIDNAFMAEKLTKSFTVQEWINLRASLQNKALLTKEWEDTIILLKERIYERYFSPLKILIENSPGKGDGFTILTIECSLIEFLATLEDGRIFKRDKISTDKHWYYNRSAQIFQRFLRTEDVFNNYFSAPQGLRPRFSTHDFYQNVRCALIHEAQTRELWEVKIFKTKTQDNLNTICFDISSDGKKLIYRTALFKALSGYFDNFIGVKLKLENEKGRTLRKHLARKIDHIAEIQPDNKYWWK